MSEQDPTKTPDEPKKATWSMPHSEDTPEERTAELRGGSPSSFVGHAAVELAESVDENFETRASVKREIDANHPLNNPAPLKAPGRPVGPQIKEPLPEYIQDELL